MTLSDIAKKLFGAKRAETTSKTSDVSTLQGTVVSDSENGHVEVAFDADCTTLDGTNVVSIGTLASLKEGDQAIVMLEGGGVKRPTAIGAAGWGDRIQASIVETNLLIADKADIEDLEAANAHIGNLEADNLTINNRLEVAETSIGTLEAETAKIENLTAEQLEATTAYIEDLTAGNVTAQNIVADHGDFGTVKANAAKVQNLTAQQLEADHATVGSLDANYAKIDLANIANGTIKTAMIGDAQITTAKIGNAAVGTANIKNAAITNALIANEAVSSSQILSVSANKLTAGTINAAEIDVTNLHASSLIVDKLNGQPVLGGYAYVNKNISGYSSKNPSQEGWYEMTANGFALSTDTSVDATKAYYTQGNPTKLYDQDYIDGLEEGLNQRIDGAIETFTGDHVPTLNTYPAVDWTTDDAKSAHVGDIYFVTNDALNEDGYNYRFAYDNTRQQYMWVLIKDSDVTKALQDITDLQDFESDTTSWINETDQGLVTIRQNHTALSGVVDKTVKESVQLWYTKADTTAPGKPTSQVTSTSTAGNAWRTVVPAWNASYPNYYYCWQYKLADNTYAWSDVVRDIAMGESQGTSRSAQTTANANIKSSVQLWYTSNSTTPPAAPTSAVTATTTTAGAWTTKVPTYASATPKYHYCFQQQKGDGTYQWTTPVYDDATTTSMAKAQAALPQSTFTYFQQNTFKELVDEVDEQSSTITTMGEKIETVAYQNLTPWFSMPLTDVYDATTNPKGYWSRVTTNSQITTYESCQFHNGSGGWVHIVGNVTSGNPFVRFEPRPIALKPSTKYTFMVEIDGTFASTFTNVVWRLAEPNEGDAYDLFSTLATVESPSSVTSGTYYKTATTNASFSNAVTLGRAYVQFYGTGAVDVYARISLYEGEYSGPYKPYVPISETVTLTNVVNQVKQTADANTLSISGLTTTTQSLRDDLDNLEIGGRNLLLGRASFSQTSYGLTFDYDSATHILSINGTNTKTDSVWTVGFVVSSKFTEALIPGEEYTLTGYDLGGFFTTDIYAQLNTYITTGGQVGDWSVGKGRHIPSATSTVRSNHDHHDGWANLFVGIPATVRAVNAKIRFKFEKGNKATDWSPAPEDAEQSITTLESRSSKIEQTLDGFSSTVGAIVDETVAGTNILTGNALNPFNWTISAPTGASYTKTAYGTAGVKVQFSAISGWEWLYSPAITVVSGKKYTLSVEYTVGKDYTIVSGKGGYGLSVYKTTPPHSSYDNANANFIARAQFFETATRVAMKATVTFTASSNSVYLGLNGGQLNDGQSGLSFTMDKLTLVENISSRMSSAETSITQTSNAIGLTATGTATISNPNLTPWFSISVDDTSYWAGLHVRNGSVSNSEGLHAIYDAPNYKDGIGWAHVTLDARTSAGNNGSVSCYMNMFLAKEALSKFVKPGGKYTWLIEVSDLSFVAADSSSKLHVIPSVNNATMDVFSTCDKAFTASGSASGVVTAKSSFSSLTQDTRGYCYVPTGCYADFYLRISLYEGEYTGQYKPYVGSKLYASQAELKVANDAISARVEKNGVIASINASIETSGGSVAKISADKVNIEGATIFTTGRLSSGTLDNKYDSKGSASAVQTKLDNLKVGGANLLWRTASPKMGDMSNGYWSKWVAGDTVEKTADGIKITCSSNGSTSFRIPLAQKDSISVGDELVLSFDYRGNLTGAGAIYMMCDPAPNISRTMTALVESTTNWVHFEQTFSFSGSPGGPSVQLMFPYRGITGKWLEIKDSTLMLEKATKASSWQPSTADLTGSVFDGTTNLVAVGNTFPKTATTSGYFVEYTVNNGSLKNVVTLEAGVEYTLSADITSTVDNFTLSVGAGNGTFAKDVAQSSASHNGRVSLTFTPTSAQLANGTTFAFRAPRYSSSQSFAYTVDKVKLVKGGVATDWSPASEDYMEYADAALERGVNLAQTYCLGIVQTTQNVTCTGIGPTTIRLNGTAAANGTPSSLIFRTPVLQPGKYCLWLTDTNNGNVWFRLGKGSSNTHVYSNAANHTKGNPYVFDVTAADTYAFYPVFKSGVTFSNFETSYMLEKGEKATVWKPAPEDLVAKTQRIYYRTSSSTKPSAPSTWVTEAGNKWAANNTTATNWTTKVTPISNGTGASVTKYLYLWTCEQSVNGAGSLTNSAVLLDDTTTVINGGDIITGSVTANQLAANSVTADKIAATSIAIGKLDSSTQTKIGNGDSALTKVGYYNRHCVVGQSGSGTTNPWYKFASSTLNAQYTDHYIVFDVFNTGGFTSGSVGDQQCGRLSAHFRSGGGVNVVEAPYLKWENRGTNITLANFVLAYKLTAGTKIEVELWCKCDRSYAGYRFQVVYEGHRDSTNETSDWTLHDKWSAGSSSAITSGYTQVASTDMSNAFITVDSSGIKIAKASDTSNYQYQTSSGTDIYVGGKKRTSTNANGLEVFDTDGTTSLAKFGTSARIGKSGGTNVEIEDKLFKMNYLGDNVAEIRTVGLASDETANAGMFSGRYNGGDSVLGLVPMMPGAESFTADDLTTAKIAGAIRTRAAFAGFKFDSRGNVTASKIANLSAVLLPVTLFYNSSGGYGTINLNETVANFVYIEVFGQSNDGEQVYEKVYDPNGKTFTMSVIVGYGMNKMAVKSKRYVANGTQISVSNLGGVGEVEYLFAPGGVDGHNENQTSINVIKIYRVLGLRK